MISRMKLRPRSDCSHPPLLNSPVARSGSDCRKCRSPLRIPDGVSGGRCLTRGTRLSQRRRPGHAPAGGGRYWSVAYREGADGSHLRLASGRAGDYRVHVRFHRFRTEWGDAPARAAGSKDRRYRGSGRFPVHDVVREGRRRRLRGDLRQRAVHARGDRAWREIRSFVSIAGWYGDAESMASFYGAVEGARLPDRPRARGARDLGEVRRGPHSAGVPPR